MPISLLRKCVSSHIFMPVAGAPLKGRPGFVIKKRGVFHDRARFFAFSIPEHQEIFGIADISS